MKLEPSLIPSPKTKSNPEKSRPRCYRRILQLPAAILMSQTPTPSPCGASRTQSPSSPPGQTSAGYTPSLTALSASFPLHALTPHSSHQLPRRPRPRRLRAHPRPASSHGCAASPTPSATRKAPMNGYAPAATPSSARASPHRRLRQHRPRHRPASESLRDPHPRRKETPPTEMFADHVYLEDQLAEVLPRPTSSSPPSLRRPRQIISSARRNSPS